MCFTLFRQEPLKNKWRLPPKRSTYESFLQHNAESDTPVTLGAVTTGYIKTALPFSLKILEEVILQ